MEDKKQIMIDELSKESEMVIATAYLYAKTYTTYGEDITKAWTTATQQKAILDKAYREGYADAERRGGKCTDCEKYNHEKHYCPKFCDVIRKTTKEMQEFYKGEHEKLERIEKIVNEEMQIMESDLLWKIKEVLENG